MTWDTVAHNDEKHDIPLVVKGVMHGDDASRCVEAGDVIYVSNQAVVSLIIRRRVLMPCRGCRAAAGRVRCCGWWLCVALTWLKVCVWVRIL